MSWNGIPCYRPESHRTTGSDEQAPWRGSASLRVPEGGPRGAGALGWRGSRKALIGTADLRARGKELQVPLIAGFAEIRPGSRVRRFPLFIGEHGPRAGSEDEKMPGIHSNLRCEAGKRRADTSRPPPDGIRWDTGHIRGGPFRRTPLLVDGGIHGDEQEGALAIVLRAGAESGTLRASSSASR